MVSFEKANIRNKLLKVSRNILVTEKRVVLEWGTGVGKTKASLELTEVADTVWDIVVPRETLIQNWRDEIDKWGFDQSKFNIFCYDSLHKHQTSKCMILDEVHNVTSLRINKIMEREKMPAYIIGLSATVDAEKKRLLTLLNFADSHYVKFSTDKGVEAGITPDYEAYAYLIPMSENKEIHPPFKYPQTEKALYNIASNNLKKAKSKGDSKQIEFWSIRRYQIIQGFKSKERVLKYLVDRIPEDKRAVIFGGSTAQIDRVCEHTHHSKNKKENNLERWKAGEFNVLGCVGMLDEGMNFMADIAIAVGINSKARRFLQRLGRLLRPDPNNPEKKGVMIVLIADNTQEIKWLSNNVDKVENFNIRKWKV